MLAHFRHLILLTAFAGLAAAQDTAPGEKSSDDVTRNPRYEFPVIKEYGGTLALPAAAEQPRKGGKILYDVKAANYMPALNAVATHINSYANAGIKSPADLKLAIVFHGPATRAVLSEQAFPGYYNSAKNSALPLLRQLKQAGVEIFVCGQALGHHHYGLSEVAPEVTVAVSALTVTTNKQMDGYGYLPFH